MSIELIEETVSKIVKTIGAEPLTSLGFDPILPDEMNDVLAQMIHYASPSYLPFARYDGDLFAFHLLPQRPLLESSIVRISHDGLQTIFVCQNIAGLPSALWLWVGMYFRNKQDILRQATNALVANIPNASDIPEAFWELFDKIPVDNFTRWNSQCDVQIDQAWSLPAIGHPFAGLPRFERDSDVLYVVSVLNEFILKNRQPELLSLLLSAQTKAQLPCNIEDILTLLQAEMWRDTDNIVKAGSWKVRANGGISIWNTVLSNLPSLDFLKETAFEPLIENKTIYEAKDRNGPLILAKIAQSFMAKNDYLNALSQARNATTLARFIFRKYPRELALMIADICNHIEKDSLAGAVAKESARLVNFDY